MLTVALVAGVFLVGACGRPAAGTAKAGAAGTINTGPAKGRITIWAFDNEGKTLSQLATTFQKENPGTTITVTPVSADELPRKLDTAVASGQVPDIIQPSTGLQSYVSANAIAPVPDGVMKDSDFFASAVDAVTFDGTKYAVPWYVTVQSFFYRADLAQKAGLQAPATWKDAQSFAKTMVASGAKSGYYEGASGTFGWQTILPLIYQAGGQVVDGDKLTLDTPEVVAALEQYQSFFRDKTSDTTFTPQAAGEVEAKFADGLIAAYSTGSYSYNFAVKALNGDKAKVGVAPLPAGPKGSAGYLGGSGLAVMKDSKNADAAWKFIRYATTLDGEKAAYTVSGVLPAAQGAWKSGELADSPVGRVFAKQVEASKPLPKILTWTQIRDVVAKYGEQVARQRITPEQAAKAMQSEAEKIGTGQK